MGITSTIFLFIFLPSIILFYFAIPANKTMKYRNWLLLLASIIFYAWGENLRILLILAIIIITYLLGFMANKARNTKRGKWAVALVVIVNVCILFVYKYLEYVFKGIGLLFNTDLPTLDLILPLGLSFLCFSSISYIVDVYRTKTPLQKNFLNLSLYLVAFFKVTQGPIMQYNQFEKQLYERQSSLDKVCEGIWRIIFGLGKKMIIATNLTLLVETAFKGNLAEMPVTIAWLGAIAYMLQIYFDFSGYSDIAIGLGKIFGFDVPENFLHPYAATSVTEYWQRWHKSLGEWLRDYVYYPITLGPAIKIRKRLKNHKKLAKLIINILTIGTIWFISSVWHGRTVNYLIWGLINGGISILELYKKPMKNKKLEKVIGWTYTIFVALMVKVLTNLGTVGEAMTYFGSMFGFNHNEFTNGLFSQLLKENWIFLLLGAITCLPIFKILHDKVESSNEQWLKTTYNIVASITAGIVLVLSVIYIIKNGSVEFIYQQF